MTVARSASATIIGEYLPDRVMSLDSIPTIRTFTHPKTARESFAIVVLFMFVTVMTPCLLAIERGSDCL
jgi:predicted tellurium resistance membrane protein TerC